MESVRAVRIEKGEIDGAVSSFFPPPAGLDRGIIRKAGGDAQTAHPGSPNSKDVSVLRIDHAAGREVLFGMWEAAQSGSNRAEGCTSGINCMLGVIVAVFQGEPQ